MGKALALMAKVMIKAPQEMMKRIASANPAKRRIAKEKKLKSQSQRACPEEERKQGQKRSLMAKMMDKVPQETSVKDHHAAVTPKRSLRQSSANLHRWMMTPLPHPAKRTKESVKDQPKMAKTLAKKVKTASQREKPAKKVTMKSASQRDAEERKEERRARRTMRMTPRTRMASRRPQSRRTELHAPLSPPEWLRGLSVFRSSDLGASAMHSCLVDVPYNQLAPVGINFYSKSLTR